MTDSAARAQIAAELVAYANARREAVELHAPELSICARRSNDNVVNAYYTAADVVRTGSTRLTNDNCTRCRGTRGGPPGHLTAVCTWTPCNTANDDA
jgi:hypothetical protein